MADSPIPYGRKTQHAPDVAAMHVLWITAGLGCDGDSIAMTAATRPSLEDLVLGAIPGLPEFHLHHPVLAYENGDEFLEAFGISRLRAASARSCSWWKGRSRTSGVRPRVAGPRWASTGKPASRSRPARGSIGWHPHAWGVVAAGTCAAYGGIHAIEGNPTGCMGLPDYLGWNWRSKTGASHRLCTGMPRPAGQLHGSAALPAQAGGRAGAHDSSRRAIATGLALRRNRP